MQAELFNSDYLGEQTPWFGPLLPGYRSFFSSTTAVLKRGQEQDVTAWVWDQQGHLLGERVICSNRAGDLTTIDAAAVFPEFSGKAGTIGIFCHARNGVTPTAPQTWAGRYVTPGGKLAGAVFSGNPMNLNAPARLGRPSAYRMCSQELLVDATWRTLSWHGNVSGNPNYSSPIKASLFVLNQDGHRLDGPEQEIAPFGSILIDLEKIFGPALNDHLKATGGRGSYMMHSKQGGAVGYHFLQNRVTQELASDHTRPVVYYLNRAYGWSSKAYARSPFDFVRAAAHYLKFRLSA